MKRSVIRLFKLALILMLVTFMTAACSAKDPLLGKWREPTSGVVIEILEEGKLVMSLDNSSITMEYVLEDPNIILLHASTAGTIPDQKLTYLVEEDTLTLTLDGAETLFLRQK